MLSKFEGEKDTDFSLSKEQEILRDSVRDFAQKEVAPIAAEIDRLAKFPRENVEKMAKLGLFGMIVPPPFGGSGMGLTSLLVAVEEIAAACASTAMVFIPQVFVEQGLLAFGTDDQRRVWIHQGLSPREVLQGCEGIHHLSTYAGNIQDSSWKNASKIAAALEGPSSNGTTHRSPKVIKIPLSAVIRCLSQSVSPFSRLSISLVVGDVFLRVISKLHG